MNKKRSVLFVYIAVFTSVFLFELIYIYSAAPESAAVKAKTTATALLFSVVEFCAVFVLLFLLGMVGKNAKNTPRADELAGGGFIEFLKRYTREAAVLVLSQIAFLYFTAEIFFSPQSVPGESQTSGASAGHIIFLCLCASLFYAALAHFIYAVKSSPKTKKGNK